MTQVSAVRADWWRVWLAAFIDFFAVPTTAAIAIEITPERTTIGVCVIIATILLVQIYRACSPSGVTYGSTLSGIRPSDAISSRPLSRAYLVVRFLTIILLTAFACAAFPFALFAELVLNDHVCIDCVTQTAVGPLWTNDLGHNLLHVVTFLGVIVGPLGANALASLLFRSAFINFTGEVEESRTMGKA